MKSETSQSVACSIQTNDFGAGGGGGKVWTMEGWMDRNFRVDWSAVAAVCSECYVRLHYVYYAGR